MACSNNNCGFLLLEVMIVMALVMLIALLVSANSSFLQRLMVRTEIEKLYSICRYLQQCALVSNRPYVLRFDTQTNTYHYDGGYETLPAQIKFGSIPGSKGPPSAPINRIQKPVTFQQGIITFYPDGVIQSGTIYVVDRLQRYMFALSSPVASVSYLRKYYYDGSWHLVQ